MNIDYADQPTQINFPVMTLEELETTAKDLYGPSWTSKLARVLGITPGAVGYWKSRKGTVPNPAAVAIRALAALKAGASPASES